jgi:hypothetical protein
MFVCMVRRASKLKAGYPSGIARAFVSVFARSPR